MSAEEETTETTDSTPDEETTNLDPGDGSDVKAVGNDVVGVDGGAAEPDAEATEATEEVATEPTYSDKELNAAKRFGFSAEDLTDLGDKGAGLAAKLVDASSNLGRKYAEIGRASQKLSAESAGVPKDGPKEAPELKFEPEEWGEDQAGKLNGLVKQFTTMKDRLAEVSKFYQEGADRQFMAEVDVIFKGLDVKVYPELGSGATKDLAEDTPEHEARQRLMGKAAEILQGYELVHGESMDMTTAFQEALAIQYPDATHRKRAGQVEARSKQRTIRPTQRRSSRDFGSPEEKAEAKAREYDKSKGIGFFKD